MHLSHQDTSSPAPPISNTVHTRQLAVPPDALLFCTSELLHGSPARTVPSSSNTGKCPLFQEAAALSGPGVKPAPLGVCHSCPLSGFLPFIPSVVLSWRPTCSPSPPCQPRPGPLRYETGVRSKALQRAEAEEIPMLGALCSGPWDQLETARGSPEEGVHIQHCHSLQLAPLLSGSSLNTLLQSRRPENRPAHPPSCLPFSHPSSSPSL